MKESSLNNEGFSLLEVLAAILILSIVLISFLTFFSQSAKFTAHNKEKLTAIQVSEEVIGKIRFVASVDEIETIDQFKPVPGTRNYEDTETYPKFNVKIEISDGPDETQLTLATINVLSISGAELSRSPLMTQIYLETGQ